VERAFHDINCMHSQQLRVWCESSHRTLTRHQALLSTQEAI